jgi:hypothetical protein
MLYGDFFILIKWWLIYELNKDLGVTLWVGLYAHTPAGLNHRPVSAAIPNAEHHSTLKIQ